MGEENNRKLIRYMIIYVAMVVILAVSFVISVNSGSVRLSFHDIITVLGDKAADRTAYQIIWNIRLPRTFASLILGGALAVSGFLLQTFFGNPIAGPWAEAAGRYRCRPGRENPPRRRWACRR